MAHAQGRRLPLGFGTGERAGEIYLGSDAIALASLTDQLVYLEEGDYTVLTRQGAKFFDAANLPVERKRITTPAAAFLFDKGNYRHFMAKEIHEQPEVVGRTLSHFLDLSSGTVSLPFELPVDAATPAAPDDRRLWHGLYGRAGGVLLVRAQSPNCRSKSKSPRNFAIAKRRCRQAA